jgi:hypothetical protein
MLENPQGEEGIHFMQSVRFLCAFLAVFIFPGSVGRQSFR